MAFRFSEQAILDGAKLYAASVQQFGRRSAEKYTSMMMDAAQLAADFPLSAPERHGTAIKSYRLRWFGAHLLVYDYDEQSGDVIIQRVLHQRQDWQDLL
jgi:plasmid stabilization system protein ParE